MEPSISRKRNVSDGDSGFDSALSSRSSSISLEEAPEFGKLFDNHDDLNRKLFVANKFYPELQNYLNPDEVIEEDQHEDPGLYVILNKVTGSETLFKPPSRLRWSPEKPKVDLTFSPSEYERCSPIPRSHIFHSRLAWELEKQLDKLDLLEVSLEMDTTLSPPPSLGIRVIGVNMIHGVQDKLNIYVKKVVENSVAGMDGRIKINDHIVSVNGISLVGVSQKLAAQTLSNCAICPETGTVHFVLGRPKDENGLAVEKYDKENEVRNNEETAKPDNISSLVETKNDVMQSKDEDKNDCKEDEDAENGDTGLSTKSLPHNSEKNEFEGRNAIRLSSHEKKSVQVIIEERKCLSRLLKLSMWSLVLVSSVLTILESDQ